MIAALMLALISTGVAPGEQWGWLGVRIRDLTEQEMEEITKKVGVSEGYGVLIAQVMKETPAASPPASARATWSSRSTGARSSRRAPLQRLVGRHAGRARAGSWSSPGERVARSFEGPGRPHARGGDRRPRRVRVRLLRPGRERGPAGGQWPSARARAPSREAPIVAGVAERSSAAQGGLRAGDRILAVNGIAVDTLEAFRAAAAGPLPAQPTQAPGRAGRRDGHAHAACRAMHEAPDEAAARAGRGGRRHPSGAPRRGAARLGIPGGRGALGRPGGRAPRDAALRGRHRGHPPAGDGRRGDPPAPQAPRPVDRGPHDDGRSHRGDRGGDAEARRVRLPHEAAGPRGAPPPARPHPGAPPPAPGGQRAPEPAGRAAPHERAGQRLAGHGSGEGDDRPGRAGGLAGPDRG